VTTRKSVSTVPTNGFGRTPRVADDRIAVLEHRVRAESKLALVDVRVPEPTIPAGHARSGWEENAMRNRASVGLTSGCAPPAET